MFELLLKNADVVTECGMQKVDIGDRKSVV